MQRRMVLCVLVATLAACDSGTGIDLYDSLLFGTFDLAQVRAETPASYPEADQLAVRFDGAGGAFADFDGDGREDGPAVYTVAGDRSFELDATEGIVNRTAEVIVSGTLTPAAGLSLGIALRQARGLDTPALAGYYTACAVGGDGSAGNVWTRRMLIQADGSENLNWTILEDSTGATVGTASFYSVVDGEIMVSDEPGGLPRYIGSLRLDGSLLVLAKAPGAGDATTELIVAVRRGAGTAMTAFRDAYLGYAFFAYPTAIDAVSATTRFRVVADGAGHASYNSVSSGGGSAARTWDYAVSPEGLLSRDGQPFGAITQDGDLFIGVDADATDGEIALFCGVRE